MRKTTIELTEEQYFFLKEKALELQKQNQNASIVKAPQWGRTGDKPDGQQRQTP